MSTPPGPTPPMPTPEQLAAEYPGVVIHHVEQRTDARYGIPLPRLRVKATVPRIRPRPSCGVCAAPMRKLRPSCSRVLDHRFEQSVEIHITTVRYRCVAHREQVTPETVGIPWIHPRLGAYTVRLYSLVVELVLLENMLPWEIDRRINIPAIHRFRILEDFNRSRFTGAKQTDPA